MDMVSSLGTGIVVVPVVAVLANVAIAKAYSMLWFKKAIKWWVNVVCTQAQKPLWMLLRRWSPWGCATFLGLLSGQCQVAELSPGRQWLAVVTCAHPYKEYTLVQFHFFDQLNISSNVQMFLGTVIVLALSFLAPYFFYIPKATLAAVLIVAASSLVDYEIFGTLWRCSSKLTLIFYY